VNGVLLQVFFSLSVLYAIFFHLGIFRHVLGMLWVLGICNMLQDPWHILPDIFCAPWYL
jgi:hypothetical protein